MLKSARKIGVITSHSNCRLEWLLSGSWRAQSGVVIGKQLNRGGEKYWALQDRAYTRVIVKGADYNRT